MVSVFDCAAEAKNMQPGVLSFTDMFEFLIRLDALRWAS